MKSLPSPEHRIHTHQLPLTRLVGGTYSPTVERLRFSNGAENLTDLIRLNPNVDAYSLDADGISPRALATYETSRFELVGNDRIEAAEAHISHIIASSYPVVSTNTLSDALRFHGYPLGNANLKAHEAIAATQAAIWFYTNGHSLDTSRRSTPIAVHSDQGVVQAPVDGVLHAGGIEWSLPSGVAGPQYLELSFSSQQQLASYSFSLTQSASDTRAGMTVWLEKSSDGHRWHQVSSSTLSIAHTAPGQHLRKVLGFSATTDSADHLGRHRGYRYFRLGVGREDPQADITLADVRFSTGSVSDYANPERVVYLYDYLLKVGRGEVRADPHVRRLSRNDLTRSDHIPEGALGPFVITGARGRVDVHTSGDQVRLLKASTSSPAGPLHTGEPFYLAPTALAQLPTHIEFVVHGQPDVIVKTLRGTDAATGTDAYTPLVFGEVSGSRPRRLFHTAVWSRRGEIYGRDSHRRRNRVLLDNTQHRRK